MLSSIITCLIGCERTCVGSRRVSSTGFIGVAAAGGGQKGEWFPPGSCCCGTGCHSTTLPPAQSPTSLRCNRRIPCRDRTSVSRPERSSRVPRSAETASLGRKGTWKLLSSSALSPHPLRLIAAIVATASTAVLLVARVPSKRRSDSLRTSFSSKS